MKTLKQDIALNQYEIDAAAVADAMIAKLRLVRRGHLALATEAGRSQAPPRRPRRDR